MPTRPRSSWRPPAVERDVALRDGAGFAWLDRRGWEPSGGTPFQLFADSIRSSGFEITRVFHSPVTLRGRAAGEVPHRTEGDLLLIGIDGEALIRTPAWSGPLTPGDIALVNRGTPVEIVSTASSGRMEIVSDSFRLSPHRTGLSASFAPTRAATDYWRVLASLINAIVGSPSGINPSQHGFPLLRTSVEESVAATILESLESRRAVGTTSAAALFTQAMAVIAADAGDPALTAGLLASRLNVSREYLHRIFAREGTTPLEQIKLARIYRARLRLSGVAPTAMTELVTIAEQSGFTSVKSMRRALREEESSRSHQ